ncbi:MAG: hypothetical protein ACK4VN_08900 [Bacteroidales bacterium]
MKKGFTITNFALIIILIIGTYSGSAFATQFRTKHTTIWADGTPKAWENSIWDTRSNSNNNWNTNFTGQPSINQNDQMFIGAGNVTGHHVVKNTGLTVGNNISIEIFSGSSLRIKGNVQVNQSFVVIVHEGASFVIEGNVVINANNDNQAAQLTIDGIAEITGNLTGLGTIHGTGTLEVDGEIGSGININPNNGDSVNVTGNSPKYCPPFGLTADVDFNASVYAVTLNWLYNISCGAVHFEVKRTLGGNVKVATVGIPKSDQAFSWTDNTGDLTAASNPVYEVSAVYANGVKSPGVSVSFENNPLPIDLLYFNARAERSQVALEWATATEINNDFFTIERSSDGHNWQIIGYETGAGNSSQTLRYAYTDSNPLEGIVYYRLKQTDFDGQFEYFAPVAVSLSGARSQAEILQVETHNNRLTIWINNQDETAQLIVANLQGRILYNGNLSAADPIQQIRVDLAQNIAGEVWVIRLSNGFSYDEKKIMAR